MALDLSLLPPAKRRSVGDAHVLGILTQLHGEKFSIFIDIYHHFQRLVLEASDEGLFYALLYFINPGA